jgi:acetate---CoA ligase (ADP-forming)
MVRPMTETQAKNLLAKFGVSVASGVECDSAERALEVAEKLGYPVVLKVSHPKLIHKSDLGGVVLGIENAADLTIEAQRLLSLAEGALLRVERQARPGGLDLICGMKRDSVFGPVIMVGMGGIFAETLDDTSVHVGELDLPQALAMIDRLRARPMIDGTRGFAPLDKPAAANTLLTLSKIAETRLEISELDINPLRVYEKGVIALDALALTEDNAKTTFSAPSLQPFQRVDKFFNPRSVAVVGPSTTAKRAGNIIIQNMKTLGYAGGIYPVNPAGGEIEGLRAYCSISECPKPLDLAVLALPFHQVEKVIKEVVAAGTQHAIVVSGGFSDAGPDGEKREQETLELCRDAGINLMGPNSIGTVDAHSGFCTSIGLLPPMKPSGISIFGQSGTFSTGFALEEITKRDRGFSKIACMGNKADIDESDFLEYFTLDDKTKVIGIYIESVKDGPRFMRAARAASAKKPVVVLKSGRTEIGARAAASHTGALAGSDRIYDAVFQQTRMRRVGDFEEFFNLARAFDMCPLPRGKRIGVVSITGVGCVLAADACGMTGMEMADLTSKTKEALKHLVPDWATITNPADIWSTIEQRGPAEAFRKISEYMIADENVDILLVIHVLLVEGAFDAAEVFGPIKGAWPDKPIMACYLGGRDDLLADYQLGLESVGIPVYKGPQQAIQVVSHLYQRSLSNSSSLK